MEKLEFFEKRSLETAFKAGECSPDLIPMGIADMDIKASREIISAIEQVAGGGDFGYNLNSGYNPAILGWMKKRHNWDINPKHLINLYGIMTGISALINLLTNENDPVLVLSPGFGSFTRIIEGNNRTVCQSQMIYENLRYTIDWADLETRLRAGVKLMILSNPHNPMGRVWTKSELHMLCDVCKKYGTYIVSDEIHADLTLAPCGHTPLLRDNGDYADHIIVATSPSKAFNMASLFVSNYVIPNDELRTRLSAMLQAHANLFGAAAAQAAYEKGEPWLEAVQNYIKGNAKKLDDFLKQNTPKIKLVPIEASFLAWLDCSEMGLSQEQLISFFREKAKLHVNDGADCGLGGQGFVRMNIACAPSTFEQALLRLKTAVQK